MSNIEDHQTYRKSLLLLRFSLRDAHSPWCLWGLLTAATPETQTAWAVLGSAESPLPLPFPSVIIWRASSKEVLESTICSTWMYLLQARIQLSPLNAPKLKADPTKMQQLWESTVLPPYSLNSLIKVTTISESYFSSFKVTGWLKTSSICITKQNMKSQTLATTCRFKVSYRVFLEISGRSVCLVYK